MVCDGVEQLLRGIVEQLDLAVFCGISGIFLLQHLDHHVVRGLIDKRDHDILPVQHIIAVGVPAWLQPRRLPR